MERTRFCNFFRICSLYNHSYEPNAKYDKDFVNNRIVFTSVKTVKKGEEITVNYNGDPDKKEKVWFEKSELNS
ncbi:hypothetical protein COV05_04170 [Candidatus Uhrbacteria bacterium CG10_big_fil_rev_8_21_14_0_10_48_16]|uniref:SET domain-containing protein n=1 Tax=Candidatus Uhrbacteria bacterium CG10_big_fil_rev_8_21_14_0_10_48_16 TaxID=1975038 RepID=A0A2M8LGL5_9BACT|nr:MAG: hypothetical protein COV05_04170 [Candidatus Uhrbacteria bacterium CG10_big_fil_rev_8_21_14_0_10_48_16]